MGASTNQLRQVLRNFGRAPAFTAVTLVTIGLGVGANEAVFSVIEGVLLKPLPYPHSEQLLSVSPVAPGINVRELPMAPSTYFIYREQGRTLQDIGLYTGDSESVTGLGEPEQARALQVTDSTLPLLGVPPLLGRWFTRQDDSPGSPDPVMLTYGYWQRKFGDDSSIVDEASTVDGKPRGARLSPTSTPFGLSLGPRIPLIHGPAR